MLALLNFFAPPKHIDRAGDHAIQPTGHGVRRPWTLIAAMAPTLLAALSGCGLLPGAPNDADALQAVQGLVTESGLPLPAGFQVASAKVQDCAQQDAPEGYRCHVMLASTEIPVVGAISVPMELRFVQRDGRWHAYLN